MRIQEFDFLPENLARQIAEIHERIPLNWDPLRIISPTKVDQTTARLSQPQSSQIIFLIFDSHGKPRGFHWLFLSPPEARILSTWVDESHRGQGWARALKRTAEEAARQRRLIKLTSRVHSKNELMIHLNQGFGFEPSAVQDDFIRFELLLR